MNIQPISYLQTDPKWKNISYATKGEVTTIGYSGCGPTAAAMLISTIKKQHITPVETCAWALKNGYKALKQGTYYTYFVEQFKQYGIPCVRLNMNRLMNDPKNPIHDKAFELLRNGHYLIALMGPGIWTSSGHFVVVWWADGVYYINDPASTSPLRLRGGLDIFRKQCRMYWSIPALTKKEEEPEMDGKMIYEKLNEYLKTLPTSPYAEEASRKGITSGLFADGDKDNLVDFPQGYLTREQLAVVLDRAGLLE